jgi:hypothetical protein
VSSGAFQRSDASVERRSLRAEPSGRDWPAIGVGLAAALAIVAIYGAGVWAVVVLVQALG